MTVEEDVATSLEALSEPRSGKELPDQKTSASASSESFRVFDKCSWFPEATTASEEAVSVIWTSAMTTDVTISEETDAPTIGGAASGEAEGPATAG